MIITKLIGGLGNQMFQYAAGAALARRLGVPLYVDARAFESYDRHALCLDVFGVPMHQVESRPVRRGGWWKRWLGGLGGGAATGPRVYKEKAFTFDPEVLGLQGDVYLDGYWQSERYFEDCASYIRELFTVRVEPSQTNREYLQAVAGDRSVSLHVRRGDYVTDAGANAVHGTCDADYYARALACVEQRAGPSLQIFVFSDDPDWAEGMFRDDPRVRVMRHNDTLTNYEDLRLMSACRHHVLANSTFSWWGAWLDGRSDSTVIAPQRWFRDERMDARDLVPQRWIRL